MQAQIDQAVQVLQAAVALFALGAIGGLVLAGIRFGYRRNPPNWLAMVHGLLVAGGYTLVGYAVIVHGAGTTAVAGLVLLTAAAVAGVMLSLRYKWHDRLLPTWLVLAHGISAVLGFGLVAYAAYFAPR